MNEDDRPLTVIASADGSLRPAPTNHLIWTERWRPRTISECVLPAAIKKPLLNYVRNGGGPHLLLVGPAGVGKTSVARAIGNELRWYTLIVNSAVHSTMTAMRGDIADIVTAGPGVYGWHKLILFDEADRMQVNVQVAIHSWLEDHDADCTFVLTTNHPDKIGAPVKSRAMLLDFNFDAEPARDEMFEGFRRRLREILVAERVECSDRMIEDQLTKHFPDFRQVLNSLQMRAT
jgi:DNA polymerase III delta prime subunit